jgi:phosphoribosyl 1,2-cyclic phosphodiesterase
MDLARYRDDTESNRDGSSARDKSARWYREALVRDSAMEYCEPRETSQRDGIARLVRDSAMEYCEPRETSRHREDTSYIAIQMLWRINRRHDIDSST